MSESLLLAFAIATLGNVAKSDDKSLTAEPSYPITVSANDVREFTKLDIDFANLKLHGKGITVVPISIQPGITGAVLIGDGTYSYAAEAGKEFAGRFHAVMLRFNPKDASTIIKPKSGESVVNKGASALSEVILAATFRHCYHRGQDAFIPPEHAIAADLFSQELGDVLISTSEKSSVVYNFTNRAIMYEKK